MKKQTLVEKALAAKQQRVINVLTAESVELSIALVRREVTVTQACVAMGIPKTHATKVHHLVFQAIKQLYFEGKIIFKP